MKRKLSLTSQLLSAVVALSLLASSSAAATDFHSEIPTTGIKGSQVGTDVWSFNAGTLKCNEVNYSGTSFSATSFTWRLNSLFTGCQAFGFISTPVDSGCEFELGTATTVFGCGSIMKITAFNCEVRIGSQIPAGFTNFTNTGSGWNRDIDVNWNLSSISYTQVSKSFPGCTAGTFNNGKFTGSATLTGFTAGGTQVGVWRE